MDILVAVDQSEESDNALVNALDIVSTFDGTVTAVHAVDAEDHSTETSSPVDGTDTPNADQGDAALREAADRAVEQDVSIETELLMGEPVEAIADYAERNDIDVIYVGHRGLSSEGEDLSGESRGPLGSVAKGLVERTQVPVTVFDRGV